GTFTISRGSKTEAEVITCKISQDGASGRGECVPYRRYGETVESVLAQIDSAAEAIQTGLSRHELLEMMNPGAARNAIDCALWDLEAKAMHRRVADAICPQGPKALETAYTLSLGEPD